MSIFGREPALILRALSAGAAVVVGFGLSPHLTETTTQALLAVVAAGFGVWQAFTVRPISPSIFATLITAGAAALAAFGVVGWSEHNVALIVLASEAVMAMLIRPQSTPVADPGNTQATVG